MDLLHLVILVAGLATRAAFASGSCPAKCLCDGTRNHEAVTAVECQNAPLGDVVSQAPRTTSHLRVENSDVPVLTSRMFRHLPNLRSLILPRNNIHEVQQGAFSGLRRLRLLDLDDNNITIIGPGTFVDVSAVVTVIISSNKLANISKESLEGLENVRSLSFSSNQIQRIPCGAFSRMIFLDELDLSNNHIQDLPECSLEKLQNLRILNLAQNDLKVLPQRTLTSLSKLKTIKLDAKQLTKVNQDEKLRHKIMLMDADELKINKQNTGLRKAVGIPISQSRIEKPQYVLTSYSKHLKDLQQFYSQQTKEGATDKKQSTKNKHTDVMSYAERLKKLQSVSKEQSKEKPLQPSSYSAKLEDLTSNEMAQKSKEGAYAQQMAAPGDLQTEAEAAPSQSHGTVTTFIVLGVIGGVCAVGLLVGVVRKRLKRSDYTRVPVEDMEHMDLLAPSVKVTASYGTNNR